MLEQAKILRIFKFIGLLKSRPRSIDLLAVELESTTRTIYRYLKLLEELGFIVDKDWHNQYFIHTSPEEDDKNIHFTENEAVLMKEVIASSLASHPLKDTLLKKLFLHSELKEIPEQILKARNGKIVNQLAETIQNKNQAILKSYHSGHSGVIRDRLVEPFDFSPNYESVLAFEPESKMTKHFKIERMGDVLELNKAWKFEKNHQTPSSDIFGISGDEPHQVELSMSLKAYLLLREEYPKSISYLSKSNNQEDRYLFVGQVNGFKGLGRFVMGLISEIDVISPNDFKLYLAQLSRDYLQRL